MSQRNGHRAAERRGVLPRAVSPVAPEQAPEPPVVLATLSDDELGGLLAREQALADAREAVAEADLELQHYGLTLKRRHGWGRVVVSVDRTTGDITRAG